MKLQKNKKGLATLGLLLVIFLAFFLMIFLVILSYGMGTADEALSQIEGDIGNNSLKEVYQNTLQKGIISMETTFPQIVSTGVLLGMVISMLIVGFNVKRIKQIWMILDIFIIIVAEAFAVLITTDFLEYVNSNPAFVDILRDTLPAAAKFILNLPLIIPIIGAVVMVATYFISKDKEEEEIKQF